MKNAMPQMAHIRPVRTKGQSSLIAFVFAIIGLVIAVTILTSQAPGIHDATDTSATAPLENVSALAKTVYGFSDIFVALGVLALVGGFVYFGLQSAKKKM